MKDFCVKQKNSETLALIGERLGVEGVNIEGLCIISSNKQRIIHFVVNDESKTKIVLENSGIEIISVSDVFIMDKDRKQITGKPGSFGAVCRTLAENGIKIKFGYPLENNRFAFGVDELEIVNKII